MCIIAAKPTGVKMPSHETIKRMWEGNHDGAGFMYVENGHVCIEKGFMKFKNFKAALEKLEKRLDLTSTPVVMHFRITTHGGTRPENTHPFPVTDNVTALGKPRTNCDLGVAHNGIITSVSPRKGISDTMEYIASQLAPLKRAVPQFYKNSDLMKMIENAVESKLCFLTRKGELYTVGNFIEDEGVLYSNSSYKEPRFDWRKYDSYYFADGRSGSTVNAPYSSDGFIEDEETAPWDYLLANDVIYVNWLEDGEYITDAKGTLLEGDYMLGEDGHVWEYNYEYDCGLEVPGAKAYTAAGLPKRYNEDEADGVYVYNPKRDK